MRRGIDLHPQASCRPARSRADARCRRARSGRSTSPCTAHRQSVDGASDATAGEHDQRGGRLDRLAAHVELERARACRWRRWRRARAAAISRRLAGSVRYAGGQATLSSTALPSRPCSPALSTPSSEVAPSARPSAQARTPATAWPPGVCARQLRRRSAGCSARRCTPARPARARARRSGGMSRLIVEARDVSCGRTPCAAPCELARKGLGRRARTRAGRALACDERAVRVERLAIAAARRATRLRRAVRAEVRGRLAGARLAIAASSARLDAGARTAGVGAGVRDAGAGAGAGVGCARWVRVGPLV